GCIPCNGVKPIGTFLIGPRNLVKLRWVHAVVVVRRVGIGGGDIVSCLLAGQQVVGQRWAIGVRTVIAAARFACTGCITRVLEPLVNILAELLRVQKFG